MAMGSGEDESEDQSGEAEVRLHLVVASTRVSIVGEDPTGEVSVVRDLVELLLAVTEERRMVILFDTRAPAVDIDLFARIARDFPPEISILVRGGGDDARASLHRAGVYRARCYMPAASAPCDVDDGPVKLDAALVLTRVRGRLVVPATIPVGDVA
jgi:hypothetical protein